MWQLWDVVTLLLEEQPLPSGLQPHLLRGEWAGHWECHIKPDWLLVYQITDDEVVLVRTGTHADLFGE